MDQDFTETHDTAKLKVRIKCCERRAYAALIKSQNIVQIDDAKLFPSQNQRRVCAKLNFATNVTTLSKSHFFVKHVLNSTVEIT